jgi:hypothetical protein
VREVVVVVVVVVVVEEEEAEVCQLIPLRRLPGGSYGSRA